MKIEIKTKIESGKSIVDTVLENRGLTRDWLDSGRKDLLDGRVMRQFNEATSLLEKHIEKQSNIAIYVDSDTDGFCSSAIMYSWLWEKYEIQATVIIPEGKIHGILPHLIPEDISLLIVPDASSSEALIHKLLIDRGTDVLVLDHHEFDLSNGEFATIINPQHPEDVYSNKNISGTGVVYKFIEGVDKNHGVDYYSNYIDLVAIATVADVMSMSTMDNKALINIGLANVKNPYFAAYHKFDQRIKDKEMSPIVVGFYMVPPINALIRLGTLEEKRELFQALVGEMPAEMVVANIGKIRDRQNRQKDPIVTRIAMTLNSTEGSKTHAVIMTTAPFNTPKAMTGLIAGQMTNIYTRPIFLGHLTEENLVGSARNINNSNIENLKDFCLDSGLFNWAAGHQSAFGYSIPQKNIETFLTYCDENLPKYEPIFYTDFKLEGDKEKVILDILELNPHFGPGFPEIMMYDEVVVKPSDISILGAKGKTVKLVVNGLEYISFDFKDSLPMDTSIWKIVGKPSLNSFRGVDKPQVIMAGWVIEPFDL